ncbi:MAG: PKD domain-containing protein [Promethearchaeota archaeon]
MKLNNLTKRGGLPAIAIGALLAFTIMANDNAPGTFGIETRLENSAWDNEGWNYIIPHASFEDACINDSYIYTCGKFHNGSLLSQLLLVKLTESGEQVWNRTWGYEQYYAKGSSIYSDGTFVYTFGYSGYDLAIVKWDEDGNQIDNLTISYPNSIDILTVDSDGTHFYIGGKIGSGTCILAKYDKSLNHVWNETFFLLYFDSAIVGTIVNNTDLYTCFRWQNPIFAKWDLDGNQAWNVTLDLGYYDKAESMAFDGTYFYVCGHFEDPVNYDEDVFLMKVNGTGSIIWRKSFDIPLDAWIPDITIQDESILVSATTLKGTSSIDEGAQFLLKLDKDGNPRWNRTWDGPMHDNCKSVITNSTTAFMVGGTNAISFGSGQDALLTTWTLDSFPQVDLSSNTSTPVTDQVVAFIPDITGGDWNLSWSWDFDDGSPIDTTAGTVTHAFNTSGGQIHVVTLNITDSDGDFNSSFCVVSVGDDYQPMVSVTADKTVIKSGQTIHFQATASGGNGNLTWTWDLDGTSIPDNWTAESVEKTYSTSLTYSKNVTVWVRDEDGDVASDTILITIKARFRISTIGAFVILGLSVTALVVTGIIVRVKKSRSSSSLRHLRPR